MTSRIYLDFDGVLFPVGRSLFDAGGAFVGSRRPLEVFGSFMAKLSADRGDVEVVLSTTWKRTHSRSALASLLSDLDLILPITGCTPECPEVRDPAERRLAEIRAHEAAATSTQRVLVFDDLPLADLANQPSWIFIQPFAGLGLRRRDLPTDLV